MNTEVSRCQSLDEKLASSDWKLRVEAYEELLAKIPHERESLTAKYKDFFPKFLTENTPSAMEKGLQVVAQCLGDSTDPTSTKRTIQALDAKALTKNLIEKILAANRPNLSTVANSLLVTVYEASDKTVIGDVLNDLASNKNPKVAIASLGALKELLVNLGPKESQWQTHYQKVLPKCSDANPTVRTASMDYLKELGRFQGDSLMPLLKSLKPVQISEIKTFVDSHPRASALKSAKQPMMVETISEKGQAVQEMDQEDIWDQLDGVKVLHKFNEAWTDKLISEPKWNEKKEKLEAMERSLDVPKIENANYTHIVKMLKRMLTDNNIAVHMACLGVIKKLCKGLRSKFNAGVKTLNRSLLLKLKERKPLVTDNVIETIMTSFQCCGIDEVIEEYKDQLKEKNPQIKCNIMKILTQYMNYAGAKCLKNSAFSKCLVTCAKENLNDGSPEVRKASLTIFASLVSMAPNDPLISKEIAGLDEKRRSKVIEMSKEPNKESVGASNSFQRSPTQDLNSESSANRNTIKKSQSVTKFVVPTELPASALGKKSVPQISTSKSQAMRPPQIKPVINNPPPMMKKSQSTANLSSQPGLGAMLEEMKNHMSHDEASSYLQRECGIPIDKINQLSQSNWKLRQQALQWLKSKFSSMTAEDSRDSAFEALMVLIKKTTNDFKESNLIVVKDVVELAVALSDSSSNKAIYLIVELLLEKLPMNKWDDQAKVAFNNIYQNHGLRKLMTCILGNSKDKTANPKITSSTILLMKKLSLEKSENTSALPYRELVSFCKGALQNPNTGVRHSALELLAVLICFNKDVNSMISDISTVQKNMINEEVCKINTQLNAGSQKDLSKALIEGIVHEQDPKAQAINLQLILDNFKQKKSSMTDEQRDQLLVFLEETVGKTEGQGLDLTLELLPHLCKKYKREFERKAPVYIQKISNILAKKPEYQAALASLRSLFDCIGGPIFSRVSEFNSLDKKIKNSVMRISQVDAEDLTVGQSAISLGSQSAINIIQDSKEMDLELKLDRIDLSPSADRKVSESKFAKSDNQMNPRLFKQIDASNQKPTNGSGLADNDKKIVNELDRSLSPKQLSDLSPKRSAKRPRADTGTDKELTFEDIGDNLSWKEHKLNLKEPKDSEIKDLRRLIRSEMGADLTEFMFSYEVSRVIEAIQKVETRMKQKSELSGFWEIMLKWALIRVFDCSREEILREAGKMIVKLINFSDRGGRHFTAEEIDLLFTIMIYILSNETGNQLPSFGSTFKFNVVQEHREHLVKFLISFIKPEPFKKSSFRSLSRCISLIAKLVSETKASIEPLELQALVNHCEDAGHETAKELKSLVTLVLSCSTDETKAVLKEMEGKAGEFAREALASKNSSTAQEISHRESTATNTEANSKVMKVQFVEEIIDRPSNSLQPEFPNIEKEPYKELRYEIQTVAKNSATRNIMVLKKLVELAKHRSPEVDYFIKMNYLSIVEMTCYLLDTILMNRTGYKERIVAIQENFETVRTALEYIQKLCGNNIILSSLTIPQFTQLLSIFTESLVVVEADRKYLEQNVDDLYTDRAMKMQETIAKFLNSAIQRTLDGPINKVFASLFSLLGSYASLPPHFDRDVGQNRLKIVVKSILKLSTAIESVVGQLNLMKLLGLCAEYLNRFAPPRQVENEDLAVKTIRTLLTDVCRCYKRKTMDHLHQLTLRQAGFDLLQKWISLLLGDYQVPELIISSAEKSTKNNNQDITELDDAPTLNESKNETKQKTKSPARNMQTAFQQMTLAPALVGPGPINDKMPLPSPGMPFKPVSHQPSAAGTAGESLKPSLSVEISSYSSEQLEIVKAADQNNDTAMTVESVPYQSETKVVENIQVIQPKPFQLSFQKGSVSDYSQYKESFLRSSIEKDSVSELPMLEENPCIVQEVDSSLKSNKNAFQSFGMKSEASVKSVNLEEPSKMNLVKPVKFMPTDIASLGKRSAVEKLPLDDNLADLYSPVKEVKRKSVQGSGKFSLNLKDPKSPNENSASSRKQIESKIGSALSNSKRFSHVTPQMEGQRILFSTNMIASNVNQASPAPSNTNQAGGSLAEEKLKMKAGLASVTDQKLADLILKFKKAMLVDYKQNAKEINDYLTSLPRESRPSLGDYLCDLSIVQRSYLMNELAQPEYLVRPEVDENSNEDFNTIYERLAQIRQKYQRQNSESNTPPLNAETVIESLEYKAREKRIDDFRQKIQTLLRQKINIESN